MLTQGEDVEVHALRQRGWLISAIARHVGRDPKTVRAYLSGVRVPGRRASCRRDPLAPFVAYLKARFVDDPHLWATAPFDEVVPLGYRAVMSASPGSCAWPGYVRMVDGFPRIARFTQASGGGEEIAQRLDEGPLALDPFVEQLRGHPAGPRDGLLPSAASPHKAITRGHVLGSVPVRACGGSQS